MSDTANAGTRIADHNLVATYESPDDARAALTLLERHGIEGGDIELFGPGIEQAHEPITNDEQRKVDLDTSGAVGRRVEKLAPVLALLLAVVAGVVGYLVSDTAVGALMSAVGGAIVGAIFGLLYGGYTGIATSEEWGDTFASPGGQTSVAVHSARQAEIDAALEALKGTAPTRMAICGRDGQLRDVA